MKLLLWIVLFGGVASSIHWTTWRRVFTGNRSQYWHSTAIFLAIVGVVLGVWLGDAEVPVGSKWRFIGIPIVFCFFHYEFGQWNDFVNPTAFMGAAYLTNILCWSAATISPVTLSLLFRSKEQTAAPCE